MFSAFFLVGALVFSYLLRFRATTLFVCFVSHTPNPPPGI